jgi:hypothetical protein
MGQILVQRCRQQRRPAPDQQCGHQTGPAPDKGQVAPRDRQDVAEQPGRQIGAHPVHEADRDQAKGQRRMRQHAQRRIHGPAACSQRRDGDRHQQRHRQRAKAHGQIRGKRQRHPQNGGMRRGIAEIGHAPPDHESPQRPGCQRQANPGQTGANKEIVKHGRAHEICQL